MKLYKVRFIDTEEDIEELAEKWALANYDKNEEMTSDIYTLYTPKTSIDDPRTLWNEAKRNDEDFLDNIGYDSFEDFEEHFENPDYDMLQDYYESAYEKLQSIYQDGTQEAYDKMSNEIDRLKELLSDYEITYEQERSHSWSAGAYPSEYFTYRIEDYDTDIDTEATIRICNGHDNGRSHNGQIDITECIKLEGKDFVIDEEKLNKEIREALKDSTDDIDTSDFNEEMETAWDKWLESL